jgi:AraC-like DNA-binding protein
MFSTSAAARRLIPGKVLFIFMQPVFITVMEYIFLIAAFNAIFFAVLLFQKKPMARHDRILISWLVYLGLYTGVYGLTYNILFTRYPLLSAAFVSLLLLQGPFLFLYISSLVRDNFRLGLRELLHFIPFFLFNIYLLAVSFLPDISRSIRLDHVETIHEPPFPFKFFLTVTALSGPVYFLFSIRLFRILDINIFNNFSYSENINLGWLRRLVYSFGFIWTLLMAVAAIHHVFHVFSWIFCTHGISLSLSVFIILIGYYGLRQREIFVSDAREDFVTDQKKYSSSGLKEHDARKYAGILKSFMEREKLYLEPEISLPGLAGELGIPPHYLSQVINEYYGTNFFEFINRYRVEEIKHRINDPAYSNLTILGIAFESGFNSKSAFNRVFKSLTGLTPSQYKRSLSAKPTLTG